MGVAEEVYGWAKEDEGRHPFSLVDTRWIQGYPDEQVTVHAYVARDRVHLRHGTSCRRLFVIFYLYPAYNVTWVWVLRGFGLCSPSVYALLGLCREPGEAKVWLGCVKGF